MKGGGMRVWLETRGLMDCSAWGRLFGVGLFCWGLIGGGGRLMAQSLPQWSEEDRELLKKGELVAGEFLLVDRREDEGGAGSSSGSESENASPVPLLETPVFEDGEGPPQRGAVAESLPERWIADYFHRKHESYLIDPQRLLTNQETLDREGFLKYYAEGAELSVRLYLFDAKQQIPSSYSLHRLVEAQYAEGPLTAVVFYFLGNPARNELLFGGEGADGLDAIQLRKMLDRARVQALEKSDPGSQMDAFMVQLSISMYWLEHSINQAKAELEAEALLFERRLKSDPGVGVEKEMAPDRHDLMVLWDEWKGYLAYGLVGGAGVLAVVLVLLKLFLMWSHSRRFRFPVLEHPPRLGADYAAGVGAVLRFYDKLDSPSAQKDELPEYLRRI